MDRLTILSKNGIYGLAKVKENEQEVESPYKNTLEAIIESWQRLAEYENIGLYPAKTIGEVSDGYHTFNELYRHRAYLFATVVNQNPEIAWKSKKHDDGTMFDGMFIVGIETEYGQATYHYDLELWDLYNCKELNYAPKWDGHTADDAIERILTLGEKEPVIAK